MALWFAGQSSNRDLGARGATVAEEVAPVAIVQTGLDSTQCGDVKETLALKDSDRDDWSSETMTDVALARLGLVERFLNHEITLDEPVQLHDLVTADFQSDELYPRSRLEVKFKDNLIRVSRVTRGDRPADTSAMAGPNRWLEQLEGLASAFAGSKHVHSKFKIVGVDLRNGEFSTTSYFQADAPASRGFVQINATWECDWSIDAKDTVPRLAKIRLKDLEEVVRSPDTPPIFEDITEYVLSENSSFRDQMMRGTNFWRAQLQSSLGIDLFGHQGLGLGDADGDGRDDIYVCQPGGLPNRLYVHGKTGKAEDISASSGLDILDRSRSALFLDLDNDADQDLALMTDEQLVIFENSGGARFRKAATIRVGTAVSLAAADYDLDSDLDIYVCGYSAPEGGESAPVPYHDANNGLPNTLLRNDGGWNFLDVTAESGLDRNNRRFTFAASWEDFDNDGDQDLYVANDFGRNNLYRNDGGKFVDIAAEAGVEDISAGMGVTWGDYNRDGLMDIYVSNMFSSAGNRVAYQRKFRPHDDPTTRAHFQRHARGNSLFENVGDGTFRDVSEDAQVTLGRWAWSSLFADINSDGWLDVLVTNGMCTNEDTKDL
jgi:hypothetical protein